MLSQVEARLVLSHRCNHTVTCSQGCTQGRQLSTEGGSPETGAAVSFWQQMFTATGFLVDREALSGCHSRPVRMSRPGPLGQRAGERAGLAGRAGRAVWSPGLQSVYNKLTVGFYINICVRLLGPP